LLPRQALIYCRVSSRAQEADGHGLQSQETRCREFAVKKGHEVAAVFPDTITGGGEFIETIMAAQGALERKQNGRQVAQKMKARMQLGYWVHNAPVGFRYQTVKGHGKLLKPDEPDASVVREATAGFAIGRFQTQAEVKRFLETKPHYPHNKNGKVRDKRVSDLLTNPLYVGCICSEVYELNWLKGQHEALISMATLKKYKYVSWVQAMRLHALILEKTSHSVVLPLVATVEAICGLYGQKGRPSITLTIYVTPKVATAAGNSSSVAKLKARLQMLSKRWNPVRNIWCWPRLCSNTRGMHGYLKASKCPHEQPA
jgi:DNA invertase Pin-like site-specific DNA recombinase